MLVESEIWAVDAVCNFELDDPDTERPEWSLGFLQGKIGVEPEEVLRLSPERFIAKLDRAKVQHAFLIAVRAGSAMHEIHRHVAYEKVAALVERFPDRFSGLAGIDPSLGMTGVREFEEAINEYGFVGAHLYPHWFEMPPDHARYYPFYAKCVELDVPIQMQVGHCLRYSDRRPLKSVGRPITLDTVACDFPELKLIGIHIGWPWTEEMIAVSYKHPNVYVGSDAYAPKYWPEAFVHYINTFGQDKVIFGTDFPVIDPERARSEIDSLNLRPAAKRKLLRDNVLRLYGLELAEPVGTT